MSSENNVFNCSEHGNDLFPEHFLKKVDGDDGFSLENRLQDLVDESNGTLTFEYLSHCFDEKVNIQERVSKT